VNLRKHWVVEIIQTVEGITVLKNKAIYHFVSICCLCLFAASSYAAPADKKDAVQIKLESFKVTVKDGKEVLGDGSQAKPGDVLEYRAIYKNVSKSPVRNLAATLPVPAAMEYVAQTANPVGAEATTDKKNFAPVPLLRANKEPIPTKEYRALRWHVATLAADQSFVVSARMKVSQQ
jgi:uncharacterized repeat protein (TIGR01451 family)